MLVFSGAALYMTSVWNKGFAVHFAPLIFIKASLIIALVYYLVTPILKILLLPLNIITLGFASIVAYFGLFYFIMTRFSFGTVQGWVFPGLQIWMIHIPSTPLTYWANLALVSISISTIINLFEILL